MLRKKRRRNPLPEAEVNVTSLMDIMTTLLFFLLLVASMSNLAVLKAGSLMTSSSSDGESKPTFTLQVSMESPQKATLWLGAIDELEIVNESQLMDYLNQNFTGSKEQGYEKEVWARDIHELVERTQESLIPIKKAFPHEAKAVIASADSILYQDLVEMVAGVRLLEEKERAFEMEDLLGRSRKSRVLFEDVLIAEAGQ